MEDIKLEFNLKERIRDKLGEGERHWTLQSRAKNKSPEARMSKICLEQDMRDDSSCFYLLNTY